MGLWDKEKIHRISETELPSCHMKLRGTGGRVYCGGKDANCVRCGFKDGYCITSDRQ